MLDYTDTHAEELINATHPFGVTPSEIIINCDDMHAFASEGVKIGR